SIVSAFLMLMGCTLLFSCKAQPQVKPLASNPDERSLLWEISGPGLAQPSYVYGTMHLLCRGDWQWNENLKAAISRSQEVYFEMDLDDAANTLGTLFFINMKGNQKLRDILPEADYKKVTTFFKDSLGMAVQLFERMKPGLLDVMFYPKLMACKQQTGVEEELMKLAKEQKKEVNGFETGQYQASLFDSIPYEEQAKGLLKTIDSFTQYRQSFDSLNRAYQHQDLTAMENLFGKEDMGLVSHMDLLLYNRNRNWVEQLKKILPKKNIFMAVGAGHLVGEKGVLALLKQAGYRVRPILNR
ncbi:MAG TPA: TraB/GumN family protein, partial [Ferruginibacter sp.]|nr:TraB/GumN family protein [Ferruginibacter sp.]